MLIVVDTVMSDMFLFNAPSTLSFDVELESTKPQITSFCPSWISSLNALGTGFWKNWGNVLTYPCSQDPIEFKLKLMVVACLPLSVFELDFRR